eukprot:Blabericola_migrator_1__3785@NODE_2137_length_3221_cov_11_319277_g1353_i0_p4_GENE_NODE_2137_length_3221_cov_11_319277_g1353_i0NODE_2137_length_3221_cov_11_319277_g1353_i0_p4_ORF_typecomplete_len113_score1_22_NODE_2137_length_3221_cov_11_319277_g1353_i025402878
MTLGDFFHTRPTPSRWTAGCADLAKQIHLASTSEQMLATAPKLAMDMLNIETVTRTLESGIWLFSVLAVSTSTAPSWVTPRLDLCSQFTQRRVMSGKFAPLPATQIVEASGS